MRRVCDVVGAVESDNNPAALRFESGAFNTHTIASEIILAIMHANKCNETTARMIACTSWGEFQIMGFNLYAEHLCAYTKNIAAYLVSRDDQQYTFDLFLHDLKLGFGASDPATLFDDANVRNAFARAYNGPGNVLNYANKIKGAL